MEGEADLGGELVSILYGPCSDTKKVVLDPVVPDDIGTEALVDLLSVMHRNDFLRFLLGEEEVPSKLHLLPSQSYRPRERVNHGHVA